MKKLLLSTVFILSSLVFTQIEGLACVCPTIGAETLEQQVNRELKDVKAVFSGKVIEITGRSQSRDDLVKVNVMERWKGISSEEVIVTVDSRSSCGYKFEVGKSYLIFANGSDENNLQTGLCLRIRELQKAAEELKILRDLKQKTSQDALITLERKPGFLKICPFYKLAISSDGKVEIEPKYFKFENNNLKIISGEIIKTQITQDQLKQLISEFERINFYSINSTFENKLDNFVDCPRYGTDASTAIISITLKGKLKEVSHYHGCYGTDALINLTKLENKIDEVVNINQLLECDKQKFFGDLLEQNK